MTRFTDILNKEESGFLMKSTSGTSFNNSTAHLSYSHKKFKYADCKQHTLTNFFKINEQ
jgi:hypothetical protein